MAAGLHWLKIAAIALGVAAVLVGLASMHGCDEETAEDVMAVKVGGEAFHLELAVDDTTRVKGLGGRTFIEPDGGMLFAFPRASKRSFVMRDCPIPIDILFLDSNGRVVAMHAMVPEEPQGPEESDSAYEQRLKRYPSKFDAQYVVELQGGMLEKLDVSEGDVVEMDLKKLKQLVR